MTVLSAEWLSDPAACAVSNAMHAAGHKVYFVGGCVRNALLARPVSDLDMATDATPDQTIAAAKAAGLKPVPTGAEHGTITVVSSGRPFEITTFRQDVETDGRHAIVRFSNQIEEDAARRDFTMNALYADPKGQVIDPLGGLPDLRAGRIRFIGDPMARIREDYLRILRFFRFHAWYADARGGLDADGLAACASLAEGMDQLSPERVGHELRKLLAADDPAPAVAAMEQTGVLSRILPGASARNLPILVHLENGLSADFLRRLALLGGRDVTERLRLSRAETKRLTLLQNGIANPASAAEEAWRFGGEIARDIALVRAAMFEQPLAETLNDDLERGAKAKFPVKAADLMPDFQGSTLGKMLKNLEKHWISSGFTLTRTELLDLAERPKND